jgi:hypothetical protein
MMSDTLSKDEIALRIKELLNTRRTGQAVADYLEQQNAVQSRRAAVADLRLRRLEYRAEVEAAACSGG